MKILILANSDAGLYHFRIELIESLVKEHEVFFCVPKGEYVGRIEKLGAKPIISEIDRRGTNPIRDIKLYRFYNKTIKNIKPNVVLTYTIKPNVYGGMACKKQNIPYIVNITGLGSALENEGILQLITSKLYKVGVSGAKCIFFQNSANRDFFIKEKIISYNTKTKLIPGSGVNTEKFSLYEYPRDKIRFLFAARILKEKGIDYVLKAAKEFASDTAEFHVCGSCDNDYREILNQYDKAGIIKYHGSVSNINDYYRECSCLLHPSYYPEGMSNVILEASACGRPVITFDRPGCVEPVIDGQTGYIVPVKNENKFLRAVEDFIALSCEEREKMGISAAGYVRENFNRQSVIMAYYDEIFGE